MYAWVGGVIVLLLIFFCVFVFSAVNAVVIPEQPVKVTIEKGDRLTDLLDRLQQEKIIRHGWLVRGYMRLKNKDHLVRAGVVTLEPRMSLSAFADAITQTKNFEERTITIIPGWSLQDIAEYLEKDGWGSVKDFFALTGQPAELPTQGIDQSEWGGLSILKEKPRSVSLEGYVAPDTYRVFADAALADIIRTLLREREKQLTPELLAEVEKSGRSLHEILTMASILEQEVKKDTDRAKVADLFWRRFDAGWALQADSTVHYVVGKKGSVFTTKKDREIDSPWNTYKYPGLPPGPISTPSLDSILAALRPETNPYWYFLTTETGEVQYAKNLAEHTKNVQTYLR